MDSLNEKDLINYITSPILTSIDDENHRLELEENDGISRPQQFLSSLSRTFTPTDLMTNELNSFGNDNVNNLISPLFSRLSTDDPNENNLDNFILQPISSNPTNKFLNIPNRSNTLSPSNSRFYDNSMVNNSTSQLQGGSNFFNINENFIQRPMSAMEFPISSNNRNFLQQQQKFDQFNSMSSEFPQQQQVEPVLFPKVSNNFNTELFEFKMWLENLNSKQQLYVVDLITKTIDDENLKILKRKLDTSVSNLDNSELFDQIRPKSADILNQFPRNNGGFSPLSDLSKTQNNSILSQPQSPSNRPQQKNRNSTNSINLTNNPMNQYMGQRPKSPMNYEDLSNQNFLKLNALSTIQSRAKLDNGKRHTMVEERGRTGTFPNNNSFNYNNNNNNSANFGSNTVNRYKTSSVPPISRTNQDKLSRNNQSPNNQSQILQQPQPTSSEANKILNDSLLKLASINNIKLQQLQQQQVQSPVLGATIQTSKSPMPKDISSLELLNNIPQWLKILRLHKYTDILSNLDWKIMINLTDEELDQMGISTLGARRKLLKLFSVVKESYERDEIK